MKLFRDLKAKSGHRIFRISRAYIICIIWFLLSAIFTDQKTDYLIFHGYDVNEQAKLKLRIEKLNWDSLGWSELEIFK